MFHRPLKKLFHRPKLLKSTIETLIQKCFFIQTIIFISVQEYYEQPEDYSEDEEGQMVIDESPSTPSTPSSPENLILAHRVRSPPAPAQTKNNFNNNELKINSFGQGFANAINIWYVHILSL